MYDERMKIIMNYRILESKTGGTGIPFLVFFGEVGVMKCFRSLFTRAQTHL